MWFICQNVFAAYTDRARLACNIFVSFIVFSIVFTYPSLCCVLSHFVSALRMAAHVCIIIIIVISMYWYAVWAAYDIADNPATVNHIAISVRLFKFCLRCFVAYHLDGGAWPKSSIVLTQPTRIHRSSQIEFHMKWSTSPIHHRTPDFASRNTKNHFRRPEKKDHSGNFMQKHNFASCRCGGICILARFIFAFVWQCNGA